MDKRLLFHQNQGRERDIFFVKEDRPFLQKHASGYHPKIQDYISKAKPIDNLIQVLITALGAYPFWPQNVNGDRFLEPALSHEGDDYGYRTFATNANYFTHHVNKDPALAKGKVLAAVWNEKAKRVELVIGIDPLLDPEAAEEIASGNNLAFSMGAKLPFDVCSICGNHAKTRLEYCDHLRYQMNQIDPVTGMLVGALNPRPKFFDISRVLIPADKTAYMWEKIAHASSPIQKLGSAELAELPANKWFDEKYLLDKVAMKSEAWAEKKAAKLTSKTAAKKTAAITKEIPVTSVKPLFVEQLRKYMPFAKQALDASAPDLDMSQLKGFSLPQIISTLLALAMVPKHTEAEELIRLFGGKDEYPATAYGPHAVSPLLMKRLLPIAQQRSFARPVLMRRILVLAQLPAEELRKLSAAQPNKNNDFHKGLAAGILAAALAFSKAGHGVGNFIWDNPILSALLGVTAVQMGKALGPGRPVVTGEVSLADPNASLYNTNWQSRFVDAQARPVTVIKTGADNNHTFDSTFGAVPFLFALEGVCQQPALSILESNPNNLNGSLLTKEASAVAQDVNDLLSSAKRIIKSASLEDIQFLEKIPENSRHLAWDLAILNAAATVNRKMS